MDKNAFSLFPFSEGEALYGEKGNYEINDLMFDASSKRASRFDYAILKKRIFVIWTIILLVFFIFEGRSVHLQFLKGQSFSSAVFSKTSRAQVIPAARGLILDSASRPLVTNAPYFSLAITPTIFFKSATQEAIHILASLVSEGEREFLDSLADLPRFFPEPLVLKQNLSFSQAIALSLKTSEIPGVSLITETARAYPTKSKTLGHIVGYLGKITPAELSRLQNSGYTAAQWIGRAGIEQSFEDVLRGSPGVVTVSLDAKGQEARRVISAPQKNGKDIFLAIDLEIQEKLESIIEKYLVSRQLKKAAGIILDPRNGAVKALISFPAFSVDELMSGDEEKISKIFSNKDQILFPRAMAGVYPPGSTIKPVIALGALSEGIVTPSTRFLSVGGIQVADRFFPDWKVGGHGLVNLADAISSSVNTYFYIIGGGYKEQKGLALAGLRKYFNLFHLAEKTGIELPGEGAGFFPTAESVEKDGFHWYIGDTYNLSIGQGKIGVTPLRQAIIMAAFANGGTLLKPRIIDHFKGEEGGELKPVVILRSIGAKTYVKAVREGLRATVERGSAQKLRSLSFSAAGKTGTAQWQKNKAPHAWFSGFAPYENPEIVITVLIEEGGEGSSLATDIAKDFLQWYSIRNVAIKK